MKDTFCSDCGTKFAEQKLYPRRCFYCGATVYHNPIPVAVGLIYINTLIQDEGGFLIIKRGNEPNKGEWALPGGFIEWGETWQQALSREIKEECGITIPESSHTLLGIENSTYNNMIIFGSSVMNTYSGLQNLLPNEEALEFRLYKDIKEELAFPTHTAYVRKYFSGEFQVSL